jgi:hypothetical protein
LSHAATLMLLCAVTFSSVVPQQSGVIYGSMKCFEATEE